MARNQSRAFLSLLLAVVIDFNLEDPCTKTDLSAFSSGIGCQEIQSLPEQCDKSFESPSFALPNLSRIATWFRSRRPRMVDSGISRDYLICRRSPDPETEASQAPIPACRKKNAHAPTCLFFPFFFFFARHRGEGFQHARHCLHKTTMVCHQLAQSQSLPCLKQRNSSQANTTRPKRLGRNQNSSQQAVSGFLWIP